MNNTTVGALQALYVALGGTLSDVSNLVTIPDMINAIAGYIGIKDINTQAEKSSATLFDTKVSNIQTGVNVADGAITGTLKYLATGPIADYWGAGNFMALKFVDPNKNTDKIDVRMNPTAGTGDGWVTLDNDMNGVFKVTATTQKFEVRTTTTNGTVKTQSFDLSGLTLETQQ
ncbi:MAG: hypothetical protein IKT42_06380 [Clostridia bacterium]|nr:hypothetical protein [Clostridia bacterium]